MSGRYLTDLATVCRAAGLVVQEEPGWQTRSRSSGGYADGRPTTIMCHHTASGASSDGQSDVNYCCYGSADRPIANTYLSRTGKVWIMAAGATNTNGKGVPLNGVPADSMNTHAVSIEAANNGVGEIWPTIQQDCYLVLVRALQSAYGCRYISSHFEWSPGRKIDPAGNSRYASGGASWDMNRFRGDVAIPPGPLPPTEEDEMTDADWSQMATLIDQRLRNYFANGEGNPQTGRIVQAATTALNNYGAAKEPKP